MRFEESGLGLWTPFRYERPAKVSTSREVMPKTLPPIPETGWKIPTDFPDLSAAEHLGFDTETFDPDLKSKGPGCRRDGYICGVSIATSDLQFVRYYPVRHADGNNCNPEQVFRWLGDQLKRKKQAKVGVNCMYDLDFLQYEGVEVEGPIYDCSYADALIDEYAFSYSLEAMSQRRLGVGKETDLLYQWCADAFGGNPDATQRAHIWHAPTTLVGPYAESDASLPIRLFKEQVRLLRMQPGGVSTLSMECRLIPLLLRMRRDGVPIDLDRCAQLETELTASITESSKRMGLDVYVGAQIAQYCDERGIKYPRTSPSDAHPDGQPSFVKDWLESHEDAGLREVAKLRKLHKLRDTFVQSALMGCHINGRIHTTLHPLRSDEYGTVGGRFSSSDPNLQQIPVRDKYWGPRMRSCFIATPGKVWTKLDLSQIEYRLGAHYGVGPNAEEVRQRYIDDPKTDFYKMVVDLTQLDRDTSKAVALGTLYGMREKKYAMVSKKPFAIASAEFEQFNEGLPFMRATYDYHQELAELNGAAAEDGRAYIQTIGGRVCHLDRGFEHKALNRRLQGSCADWIKKSMLDAYDAGIFDILDLYLTVHDELDVAATKTKQAFEAIQELHYIMCSAYDLSIPVRCSADMGPRWGGGKKVDMDHMTFEEFQLMEAA